jgi:adrenodoxin-NADP+ reductase
VGVLASTLYSAQETARHIIDDLKDTSSKPGLDGIEIQPHWTTYSDWERLDAVEQERGLKLGKPREKICSEREMRLILNKKQ